ncbi:MAG: hypothetical protein AAB556_00055 [Patescibacteria group bacterium]
MKKLVILIVVLVAGYFVVDKYYPQYLQKLPFVEKKEVMQESDEMANWKTYRNEEYGFEFKYPQDFPFGDGDFSYPPLALELLGPRGAGDAMARMGVYSKDKVPFLPDFPEEKFKSQPQSLTELVNEFKSRNNTIAQQTKLKMIIKIDDIVTNHGAKGIKVSSKYDETSQGPGTNSLQGPTSFRTTYYFYQSPYFYQFMSGFVGENNFVDSKLAQIVSTFKFTK